MAAEAAAAGGKPSDTRSFCWVACNFGSNTGAVSATSFCMKLFCISGPSCWNFRFTGDSNQAINCLSSSSLNFYSSEVP